MTRDEREERVKLELAQTRAALEKADAFIRWLDREIPIHEARTERAFRELRESVRRR